MNLKVQKDPQRGKVSLLLNPIQNRPEVSAPRRPVLLLGSRMDLWAGQVANSDQRKIIVQKESCNSPSMGGCVDCKQSNQSITGVSENLCQYIMVCFIYDGSPSSLHTDETAGHFGGNEKLGRANERFYCPGCTKDVKDWCQACDLYTSRERPTYIPRLSAFANLQCGCPP